MALNWDGLKMPSKGGKLAGFCIAKSRKQGLHVLSHDDVRKGPNNSIHTEARAKSVNGATKLLGSSFITFGGIP
jgi:hypothetical protein